jgi:hypothetical protein
MIELYNFFKAIIVFMFSFLTEKDTGKLSFSRVLSAAVIVKYILLTGTELSEITWPMIALPCILYSINKAPAIAEKMAEAFAKKVGGPGGV